MKEGAQSVSESLFAVFYQCTGRKQAGLENQDCIRLEDLPGQCVDDLEFGTRVVGILGGFG